MQLDTIRSAWHIRRMTNVLFLIDFFYGLLTDKALLAVVINNLERLIMTELLSGDLKTSVFYLVIKRKILQKIKTSEYYNMYLK